MSQMFDHARSVEQLITEHEVKKMAEIGVWKSKFLKHVLRRKKVDEYWAIDQWTKLGEQHGHMGKRSMDDWDSLYWHACALMQWFPALKVVRMESERAASVFPNGYFDLAFIDASHFYEDVKRDINIWLPKVRAGGMLCGHDYGDGRKCRGVKRAVNELFGDYNVMVMPGTVWMVRL